MEKIRRGLVRLGLVSSIGKVSERKDIPVDDRMYELIETWKCAYKGYVSEWHDVKYMTVNGIIERKRNTLGMPKVISQEMANLVFNEGVSLEIENEELLENVMSVLNKNAFYETFQNKLEYMFALGGVALEVFHNENGIQIGHATADSFIPLKDDGKRVTEGIFLKQTKKDKYFYTLLRWHTFEGLQYVIKNELYRSEIESELGKPFPLADVYPELEEEIRLNNVSVPLFVYIRPSTANNADMNSRLGVSLYANATDTLKALDVAYDSLDREIRLGKKKIIVPTTALKGTVNIETGRIERHFDVNDEVYQAINMGDDNEIKDIDIRLRILEHVDAINAHLNVLAMQTGFSPGTFSFNATEGLKTATEVVSQNSKTYRTRNGHVNMIREGLIDLVQAIIQVAELYDVFTVSGEYTISLNFDDSIAEDRNTNAAYWMNLVNSGLIPRYLALEKILKITEEQAKLIVADMKVETQSMQPADVDMFGIK
jgi:A118 family predicted phage portal protein